MKLDIHKLSNKRISFELVDLHQKTPVQINLPDLSQLAHKVWGDWGPMYEFEINPSDPISVAYNGRINKLDQTTLSVESPVSAIERRKHPLTFKIDDKQSGILFTIFLTKELELAKIKIKRSAPQVQFESVDSELSNAI